ncbi:girdin homolog isoform X2 [Macrosteles quadrilineatus]|nr:girdin homolog isoform X2 [Macrosteles quadrilineatus]
MIAILKEENVQMKKRLPELQPMHEEFLKYKQDASDTITVLTMKLNDMQLKAIDLEQKLVQFGIDVAVMETSKSKEVEDFKNYWEVKLQATEDQSKKIIDEIVKKHCEAKKAYENVILGLKEQIVQKEAEVAWYQLMMKERDGSINKEIGNLKKELEVSTMKNQELLQQRLHEVEKRANKMTRKCLKLQHDYEQRITNLKKEKDLQVQALQKFVYNGAEREHCTKENKVDEAIKELELRYRKIIINLHTATQQQRNKDLKRLTTLEDADINIDDKEEIKSLVRTR